MKKLLVLCFILSLGLFACGSGSGGGALSTAGSLSVAAPTTSNGIVTATATFSPSVGTALPGQAIDFDWYTVGVTSKTKSNVITSKGYTDKSGVVTSQYTLPPARTESFFVYVKASTGGLTNKEGWQSVQVDP